MPFGTLLQDEQQERYLKSLFLTVCISFFFIILIARLFYIQVIQAEVNTRLSKENAMRLKTLTPTRGRIFDRNGIVLARNRPSYSICVLPYKIKHRKDVINSLCCITDSANQMVFDSSDLAKTIKKSLYRKFDITRLKEDVPIDLVSVIEEHSMQLPGIIVETEARREYTLGPSAFHAIGYMGEIPEDQFDSLKSQGYFYGDLIGKAGIEREYESLVRGQCGHEYVEVNAYGKSLGPIPNIPRIDPIPGSDLYLTLDARLQQVTETVFPDSLKGAVVALNPQNGEVLVMYSSPSIDPNIFSMATMLRSKGWREVAMDSDLPLNNRVISGTYIPGSTFKLVSSLAALEEGGFTGNTYMSTSCKGAYRIGSRVAHCWKRTGHGPLNLTGAIRNSCNVYFYQVGLKMGDVTINKYASMLGMGTCTGIDLHGERSGWLSGEEAYNQRFAKRGWKWTTGLVLDLAIGQTQVVTPLQLALMVGAIGNGEVIYKPHLVKEVRTGDGVVVNQIKPQVNTTLDLKPKSIEALRNAMANVVNPGGTGWRASVPGLLVGGKTGSAENPHGDLTHALFVACAPVENPVIAISVVLENAGGGGALAAPLAGDILRYFFSETDDGKAVLRDMEVDSSSIKKLNLMVKPVLEKLQLVENAD